MHQYVSMMQILPGTVMSMNAGGQRNDSDRIQALVFAFFWQIMRIEYQSLKKVDNHIQKN